MSSRSPTYRLRSVRQRALSCIPCVIGRFCLRCRADNRQGGWNCCALNPRVALRHLTLPQVKIIDASRVSFAVKGGGHIMNPGFSSTKGVHISLNKFRDIKYTEKKKCAQLFTRVT